MDSLTHFTSLHFTSLTSLTTSWKGVDAHWRLEWPGFCTPASFSLKDTYIYILYSSLSILLKILQFYGLRHHPTFSKKSQIIVVFLLKKIIQPPKNWSFAWKKLSFFTQKDLPASQKTEILHEKMKKKSTKKSTHPRKNLKFILKKQKIVVHRGILDFVHPDPQLHQTFKPITLLFCTTSSCSDLS